MGRGLINKEIEELHTTIQKYVHFHKNTCYKVRFKVEEDVKIAINNEVHWPITQQLKAKFKNK